MNDAQKVAFAADLMLRFAQETGLTGAAEPRRYLWTDAFAVCNFLQLETLTGESSYRELALRLVAQVHRVLGRFRGDDRRSGWISGMGEEDGAAHPTAGGLRIGKPLPERQPGEPYNHRLEWDRDGQYFHYLTKWMQALHRVAFRTGEEVYERWARELAAVAHRAFTYRPGLALPMCMYWKMSTDLSAPLVASMGHHDPLDGYVSFLQLQASAPGELRQETAEMAELCRGRDWTTDDPLGLGELLVDGLRLARLMAAGIPGCGGKGGMLAEMLDAAAEGLRRYARQNAARLPVDYRLAFRELGLVIGFHATDLILGYLDRMPPESGVIDRARAALRRIAAFQPLAAALIEFWLDDEHRQGEGWCSLPDINTVMLATSLVPRGFLGE